MPAVGLTDRNNMFASLEASEKLVKSGIQPIIGCDIAVHLPHGVTGSLCLLAQDAEGLDNLRKLNSLLYLGTISENFQPNLLGQNPASLSVSLEDIVRYSGDIICLTGGASGLLGSEIKKNSSIGGESLLETLSAAFGDRLYIELQRHKPAVTSEPTAI